MPGSVAGACFPLCGMNARFFLPDLQVRFMTLQVSGSPVLVADASRGFHAIHIDGLILHERQGFSVS